MDNDRSSHNTATKQATTGHDKRGRFTVGNIPRTGFHTNPERRKNGSWKRENTARYKLEKMMQLTEFELIDIINNPTLPMFEQKLATAIISGTWAVIRDMMDEVYGRPKESIDIDSQSECIPIIRGFVLPTIPEGFLNNQTP